MTAAALVAAMLQLPGCASPGLRRNAERLAPLILAEAGDLDPVLAARVACHESNYRFQRTGALGEVSPWQLKLDATADPFRFCADVLPRIRARSPRAATRCAMRLLRRARDVCGGEPADWLGRYHGAACGPSAYGTAVLNGRLNMRVRKLGRNGGIVVAAMEEDGIRGDPRDFVVLHGAALFTHRGEYAVMSNATGAGVDPRNVEGDGAVDPGRERTVVHRRRLYEVLGKVEAAKFWYMGSRTRR